MRSETGPISSIPRQVLPKLQKADISNVLWALGKLSGSAGLAFSGVLPDLVDQLGGLKNSWHLKRNAFKGSMYVDVRALPKSTPL